MGYTPHVAVVGGGVVGVSVARDLAMRGLDVTLVDRGSLATGATGRTHGLLYSGARVAAADPELAAACARENDRLRVIASHCIEETGGLLAGLPGDGDSVERTRSACEAADIDAEAIDGDELQKLEPRLSPSVERGLFVSDATVDSARLTAATAASAADYGVVFETGVTVTDLLGDDGAVTGLTVERADGSTIDIDADYVVNAAGGRAAEVAAMADLDVELHQVTGRGVVVGDRPTEAVVSRCRPGGPHVVPAGRRSILGALDRPDTDANSVETGPDGTVGADALDSLLDGGEEMLPTLSESRILRATAGTWPTTERWDTERSPASLRPPGSFRVLDHEDRDGIWGLSTVLGGSVTLHRLVAERVTDHVCAKFGITRDCLTADHPLPGSEGSPVVESLKSQFDLDPTVVSRSAERLGSETHAVLSSVDPNPVLCACESVTRAEVRATLDDDSVEPIDLEAVCRRTGAGAGTCQGGRCAHRLAAELYPAKELGMVDDALESFLQDRWSGQRPVLWGDQLADAAATHVLHAVTLNRTEDGDELSLDAFDAGRGWDDEAASERGPVP